MEENTSKGKAQFKIKSSSISQRTRDSRKRITEEEKKEEIKEDKGEETVVDTLLQLGE